MTESEILLIVMDLLNAMQTENLEETKKLVDFLNKNFVPIDQVKNFNELIPVHKLVSDNENNESYLYVVNNLHNLEADELKWNLNVSAMMKKNNNNEISNFLKKQLSLLETLQKYQINSLIRLSLKINDYNSLNKIRKYLKEGGK